MPDLIGPAIARDRLRARLRELRDAQSLSIDAVERDLGWPASTLQDIESGEGTAQPLEVKALLEHYRVDADEILDLTALARIARSGRSLARHRLTDEYQQFVDYESEASRISIYQALFVPGLLQTRGYARALTAAILGLPPAHSDVNVRVQLRAERQQVLEDRVRVGAAPEIVAVVEESVLRRPVGGVEVLREQLAHLLVQDQQPHVTLVIMPADVGGHVGLGGVFELLEFAAAEDRDLVFIEAAATDYLHGDREITALYRAKVDSLLALGPSGDSARGLIQEALNSLPSQVKTELDER